MMITLSPRLKAAADMSRAATRIIDVGCDHGYLSAYMLMQKNARHVYACDINQGPLDNAAKTADTYGLRDNIEFRLCDGLEPFCGDECDTVFICGMGGELIADILSRASWTRDGRHTLILQPMTRAEKLREFLSTNGYSIDLEKAVEDDGRVYSVMRVIGATGDCGSDNRFLFADSMVRDEYFYKYVSKLLDKYRAVYNGKIKAQNDVAEESAIIKLLEETYANR
ncbi:MAG: SAM-dependent methyltransferase [Clostridia bacterium]|nr:SAM-dependent methyltransferase [Clostridia bacterium]